MKNFGRAFKLALRYRITIAGIILSSLGIALLWGANLGTVYPIVEVVFRGDSLPEWADKNVDKSQKKIADLKTEIKQLQQQAKADPPSKLRLQGEISKKQSDLKSEQKSLAWVQWIQPFVNTYMPTDAYLTLVWIVAFVFISTLLKVVLLATNMILVARLGQRTLLDLRTQFFTRLLRMDLNTFGRGRSGDLMSRFTGDTSAVTASITFIFGKSLREPLKMLVCLIGAAFLNWRLLIFSLLICPLAIFFMVHLARSIKRSSRRVMEEMSRLFNRLSETFSGIQAVKAFTTEKFEQNRLGGIIKQLYKKTMRITTYDSLARANNELLGIGIICVSFLAGGYLVLNQETHLLGVRMAAEAPSIAAMMTFYALLIGVSDPARKLADVVNIIQRGRAGADRVYALLDREPKINNPVEPKALPDNFEIEFDNVNFHYTAEQAVLLDIQLTIRPGETLAIVGPNGCGKSTLANMIPRFFDPVSGSVKLAGVDLRDLRIHDVRSQIGMVTQQTVLFDDTIANNIRYGSADASEQEVIAAAKKAKAHQFIVEKTTDGYETTVGERGSCLSGGQRQRIALARAILRDPKILILDEATSQIDPESELLIHRVLEQFLRDRTAILITHRLSTLDLADRIAVMDAGRILDTGTHQELIGRCDLYRRLYRSKYGESA